MPKYQVLIADFQNIPIGTVKNLEPNFMNKEKYVFHCENLKIYLRLGLKIKKTSPIRIQSIIMTETIYWVQHKIKNRSRKKWRQRWKSLVQINDQCYIQKNNGELKKQNQCKTSKQWKRLFNPKKAGGWLSLPLIPPSPVVFPKTHFSGRINLCFFCDS